MFSMFSAKSDSDRCAPEQFTTFPVPGDSRRRMLSTFESNNHIGRDWLLGCVESRSVQDARLHETTDVPYSREYWMPDKLCKACYECELPFNVLRRKHHCRFCGQVFCHSCSSHFVDGRTLLLVGMVRACKLCNNQVSKNLSSMSSDQHCSMQTSRTRIHEQDAQSGSRCTTNERDRMQIGSTCMREQYVGLECSGSTHVAVGIERSLFGNNSVPTHTMPAKQHKSETQISDQVRV